MKKTVALIAALLLLVTMLSFSAGAASPRLDDSADVLFPEQEANVAAVLDEISLRQNCDIVVAAVDSIEEELAIDHAKKYYNEHGFSDNGIMLLIVYDRGTWIIYKKGFGATAITEAGEDYIGDETIFLHNLSDVDGAFICFAKLCDAFLTQAKSGKPYDTDNLPDSSLIESWGVSPRLDDEADLLTADEEAKLAEQLNELSERQGFDVTVVTTYSTGSRSVMEFADDYYDYHNYSENGILLLISMKDRDWWISTAGYGITAFTDEGIDYIGEKIVDDLGDGEYYDAFVKFAGLCDDFINQAKNGSPYDVGHMPYEPLGVKWILFAVIFGLIFAGIVVGHMASKLKSVKMQVGAGEYLRKDSFNLTTSRDTFLYKNISKTEIPRESSSGGGGSSSHSSSSGSSHGGGGGKF